MTDVFTKKKRSEIMSKIRGRDTKLEKKMETLLEENCFDYVKHPKIFGNPDFLVRPSIAVFCDSSFWHGRNWPKLKMQLERTSNPNYWVSHISKNRRRDKLVNNMLSEKGYKVLRFWDDEIFKNPDSCMRKIRRNGGLSCEST